MSSPLSQSDPCKHRSLNGEALHDVIIVGAGPCGLAIAARLCEHTPAALFTDEEHRRYHWIRKHGRRMSILNVSNRQTVPAETGRKTHRPQHDSPRLGRQWKTLVLDASGDKWMANWNRLFKLFNITHLRSPMFFHVDPRDRDGLLGYVYEQQRDRELREIQNCVGKEVSKHKRRKNVDRRHREAHQGAKAKLEVDERDRKDYFTPSSSVFTDHCECVIDRYGLNKDLISQEAVRDIDFGSQPGLHKSQDIFSVETDHGTHYARAVVLAVGAGNSPVSPFATICQQTDEEGQCHSNKILQFPHPRIQMKIKQRRSTNIMIVGGGLSSAQLADLAIRKGVDKVRLLVRGNMNVKPFDVNLEWMGKFKNHEKAVFWSADSDEERLEYIRSARGGGSITPLYHKIVKKHVDDGKLSIFEHTSLDESRCRWDRVTQTWKIVTTPATEELEDAAIDYIYFATGTAPEFTSLPFLQTMQQKYPLHGHGGFPCLSEDLMWRGAADGLDISEGSSKVDGKPATKSKHLATRPETGAISVNASTRGNGGIDGPRIPLFITGRLASLRLGPGAGNLEGARLGAERIAWALQDILGDQLETEGSSNDDSDGDDDNASFRYAAGIGSRYESLSVADI